MTNVMLIHGSFGKPFENWLPWLEGELTQHRVQCFVPHFPTPEYQNYQNWSLILDAYREIGIINQETILVGHSLGALFVAKYILHKKVNAKCYIAVAGFNRFKGKSDRFYNVNKLFFTEDAELQGLKNYIDIRHCFISDNDSHLPIEKLKEFVSLISAECHLIPGAGHFNADSGFKSFDLLAKLIMEIINS
jgi:uncharacterized protein